MSTIVTSPVSPRRAEWQRGDIPRLSYRNPIPADESLPEHLNTTKAGKRVTVPALSIREIREALPREKTIPVSSPTMVQPQKGKKSFLGSIFAKEPSMAALDQVAQQMMQQHNAVSTKSIPYVSQQKMPNHVPKVNSKWDGVPEYVKSREKEEKDKVKAARRISLLPTISRSRSGEIEQHAPRQRRNSNEGSTAESWDSRSTDSRPVYQDSMSMRPASIYSASSNGSITIASQPFSEQSQYSVSSTGMRSSEFSPLYPNEMNSPLNGLQRTSMGVTISTNNSRSDQSPRIRTSTADTVPDYTSSPIPTPLENSPRTPGFFPDDGISLDAQILRKQPLSSIQPQILPVPVGAKKGGKQPMRSDTHSGRRVHSNTAIRIDTAPWEVFELPTESVKIARSSRSRGHISSKSER